MARGPAQLAQLASQGRQLGSWPVNDSKYVLGGQAEVQVLGAKKLYPGEQVKHSNSVLPMQVAHLELHSNFKKELP